jgi:hypothetical protein
MIKPFKFFKGYVYSDEYTFQDTPEGHMSRRMLYHTNRGQYDRLRHPNNEMERYFYDRNLRHDRLTEERRADVTRWINEGRDLNDNPIRLFNTTTVTKVNPKWWMKIKIVLQESWLYDPIGVVVVSALTTIVTIIGIAKLLNAW